MALGQARNRRSGARLDQGVRRNGARNAREENDVSDGELTLPLRTEAAGGVLDIQPDGTWSFTDADGASGWKGLGFEAHVGGERHRGRPGGIAGGDGELVLRPEYPPSGLAERVTFRRPAGAAALTVDRVFTNEGELPVAVAEIRTVLAHDRSGVLLAGRSPSGLRVVHVSNLRETARRSSHAVGPLLCPLPEQARLVGDSEGHPFPALALCDAGSTTFLLAAATQQDVFTQMWLLRAQYDPQWTHSVFADYAAIARDGRCQPVTIAPGASRRLGGLFYQIRPGDLQDVYDDYLPEIDRRCDFNGKRSPLLTDAFYCTWNYTFFHNISEDILRAQAERIAQRLGGVKHFLIDDGYQLAENTPSYDCGKYYPDPAANVDAAKFPNGMRAISDMLRSHGLRPALWWSPAMGRRNRLVEEHPDWLCLDEDGNDWAMDPGPERKAALDFSVPAVRDFIEGVLDLIFGDWGFEGMKLDFCTYPFDCKDLRFRGGEGVRWWYWFLDAVARRIPDGGIFQLCGGAPYGNPFMARYVDHHRVGGDIGKGDWAGHKDVSRSPLPLLAVPGRATMLMDVDSAGICADMNDDENLHRLNFCHITSGALNIGGDLTKLTEEQLGWLKRITDHCDRGYKVRCPDRRAFAGEPLPEVLYVDYPPSSPTAAAGARKEIAFFNWLDEPKTIGYSLDRLGISETDAVTDFWTGKPVAGADGQLVVSLRRRASRLLQVRS